MFHLLGRQRKIKLSQIKSNRIKCLFLRRAEKPEYPKKNLMEKHREQMKSTHIWHPVHESNPGHTGERRVSHPCTNPAPLCTQNRFLSKAPVVQRLDSTLHWTNHYLVDNTINFDIHPSNHWDQIAVPVSN